MHMLVSSPRSISLLQSRRNGACSVAVDEVRTDFPLSDEDVLLGTRSSATHTQSVNLGFLKQQPTAEKGNDKRGGGSKRGGVTADL